MQFQTAGEMIDARTTKSRTAVSLKRLFEIRRFMPHTTLAINVQCRAETSGSPVQLYCPIEIKARRERPAALAFEGDS